MGIDINIYVGFANVGDREIINDRVKRIHEVDDLITSRRELVAPYGDDWDKQFFNLCLREYGQISSLFRYWSPSYPRGPFFQIYTTLCWLNRQPEVIEVRYGGDENFEEAQIWTDRRAEEYLNYWIDNGCSNYFMRDPFSSWIKLSKGEGYE